eukprot:Gb_38228 [translate_table: standard]
MLSLCDGAVLRRSGIPMMYEVKGCDAKHHSRELFCWHTFLKYFPLIGFEGLVEEALSVPNGLPLSLKVFGGHQTIILAIACFSYWKIYIAESAISYKIGLVICRKCYNALPDDSNSAPSQDRSSVNGGALGKISESKWGYGIRLSFSLSDRLIYVRLCGEFDKPNGTCGIGFKCICHPHECSNLVLNQRH